VPFAVLAAYAIIASKICIPLSGETRVAHLFALSRTALTFARLGFTQSDVSGSERLVRATYQGFLQRDPTADELRELVGQMQQGYLKPAGLLHQIVRSPEFAARYGVVAPPETKVAPPPEEPPTPEQLYQRTVEHLAAEGIEHADLMQFLKAAYAVVLKREPDETGISYFTSQNERNEMNRVDIIAAMMASVEYLYYRDLPILPIHALHQARMQLFQQYLPPARRVLDLGGAAHNHAEGALLLMGYPHRPEEIMIVDLPPPDRIGGEHASERVQELVTGDGIKVRYLYRSMADLADIPAASLDMVVSGESIEHISEADAELVCREVYRILEPGGSFCLDTPNALLTRLESPDKFIHPEHQKEYLVHELRDMLVQTGFTIAEEKAVCPMPESLHNRHFDAVEITRNIRLSDDPTEGYVFFIRAVKPKIG
jgi:SAM-dependent methyltransferase